MNKRLTNSPIQSRTKIEAKAIKKLLRKSRHRARVLSTPTGSVTKPAGSTTKPTERTTTVNSGSNRRKYREYTGEQREENERAITTFQKKQRQTAEQETSLSLTGEIGTLGYCRNQTIQSGMPCNSNALQYATFYNVYSSSASSAFLPASAPSCTYYSARPNATLWFMAQSYEQPLEPCSKHFGQFHSTGGVESLHNFNEPILTEYQSVKYSHPPNTRNQHSIGPHRRAYNNKRRHPNPGA